MFQIHNIECSGIMICHGLYLDCTIIKASTYFLFFLEISIEKGK